MNAVPAILLCVDFWDIAGEPALRLELVEIRHVEVLERFERTNRAFFARHVSDRGDDYFERFEQRLATVVDENRSARSLCFALVDSVGEVVGRVNLYDIDNPDITELGFRMAETAQGKGVASRAVNVALRVASTRGVVGPIIARASTMNVASQHVLANCGFSVTGQAEPPAGSSKDFVGYRRTL